VTIANACRNEQDILQELNLDYNYIESGGACCSYGQGSKKMNRTLQSLHLVTTTRMGGKMSARLLPKALEK